MRGNQDQRTERQRRRGAAERTGRRRPPRAPGAGSHRTDTRGFYVTCHTARRKTLRLPRHCPHPQTSPRSLLLLRRARPPPAREAARARLWAAPRRVLRCRSRPPPRPHRVASVAASRLFSPRNRPHVAPAEPMPPGRKRRGSHPRPPAPALLSARAPPRAPRPVPICRSAARAPGPDRNHHTQPPPAAAPVYRLESWNTTIV